MALIPSLRQLHALLSIAKKKIKIKNLLPNKLPCSSAADLTPWFPTKLSLHHAKVPLTGHNVYREAFLGWSVCTSTFKKQMEPKRIDGQRKRQ